MFEPFYGSHVDCVATLVIYYNFWCVLPIPNGGSVSRTNRSLSYLTLILNIPGFRPLLWLLAQKLNDRPVSSSFPVGHLITIPRNTLGPTIYRFTTNGDVVAGSNLQMGNRWPPDLQLFYGVESIQDGGR